MLELYHWEPNLHFLKPLIALAEKQVDFTSHYFNPLEFEQFAPGFPANLESSLQLEREGPVLVHDGTVITSSFFMLEYIAEALPGVDLYPGEAYEHYRARAWGQFLTLSLGAGVSALGCAKYLTPVLARREQGSLRARLEQIEPRERRTAWLAVVDGYREEALSGFRQRLAFPVGRVEQTLRDTRWLAGAAYSIADIEAFALLAPLPDLAPEVVNESATPRIVEFLARMGERPAVKAALARSRTGRPLEAFVPGAEPSRWG